MALPSKPLEEVATMRPKQRTAYFEEFARFIEDAPRLKYAIRVGSQTIFSDDTMDLRKKFDRLLARAVKTG
jgi:hypothetical protein